MQDERSRQEEARLAAAATVYFLAVAVLVFAVTLCELAGLRGARSALLWGPFPVGWPQAIWTTFWVALAYYPLALLPSLCFAVTRQKAWLALQALCLAAHVASLAAHP